MAQAREPGHKTVILPIVFGLLAAACATVPTGPSVMVLPGHGTSFEQFQIDDVLCRQWAAQQTGTTPTQVSTATTVGGAAVGTAIGAAAGAAIGAAAGSPATGAAVGAGTGMLGGTAIGAGNARGAGFSVQRRYDVAYMQCLYAKGHQIPAARGTASTYTALPPPPVPTPPALAPGVPPPPAGPPPPPLPAPPR